MHKRLRPTTSPGKVKPVAESPSPETLALVYAGLKAGKSPRTVAKETGVKRALVYEIRDGKYGKAIPRGVVIKFCPICRVDVEWPCRACRTREWMAAMNRRP